MKFVVNSKQMKEIDRYTIETMRIPQMVLMERAALSVVERIKIDCNKKDRIAILCGPGNNGGDGVAAGRILHMQGYHVALLFIYESGYQDWTDLLSPDSTISEGLRNQLVIAKNVGVPVENNKLREYNVIIDALFGVGMNRELMGFTRQIVEEINSSQARVYSVDIPSGISSDTGKVMGVAVRAHETITFACMKMGMLLYPGSDYVGKVTVTDIGFPLEAIQSVNPTSFYYEKEDLSLLPNRVAYSNKGTYGKILVIGGNQGMSGAPYLSAKSAYRTGAGLVKVMTHSENRNIIQSSLPEALFIAYDQLTSSQIQEELQWASVVVIGPGLGTTEESERLFNLVLSRIKVPLIIDADGLNILAKQLTVAGYSSFEERRSQLSRILPENTILTPHLLELSRLIGISIEKIKHNLIDTANQCSYNNKLIYVIKDARTLVVYTGQTYINISGNHGMATGGCGDVLSGILGGLLQKDMEPYQASCLGVYLHGCAGDVTKRDLGAYSLMAGDLIERIPIVMMECLREE